jgi:prepilin-type N-terminal cleavage/methylation domain-containing protein
MVASLRSPLSRVKGFSLIEMAIALVIFAIGAVVLTRYVLLSAHDRMNEDVARQTRALGDAALRYTIANHDSLVLGAGPATPVQVSVTQLMAGAYLPANTATTNAYGQTYQVSILKDTAGNLLPLVTTTGGQVIAGGDLRAISRMVTSNGGSGGFIDAAASDTPGPTYAVGQSGWKVLLSTYGVNPGAGHVADAVFFTMQSAQTENDVALHRAATAGHPEYNTMSTDLNYGGHSLANAATGSFSGQIGVMGKGATTGLPSGWTGGIHSWDIYGEGTFGMGQNGSLNAYVTNTGEFYTKGSYRSTGTAGWHNETYDGGIYMTDANWVRIYNNKGLYTEGQVKAGSVVSTGRVDAKEFLQIEGSGTVGNSCSPNGLMGNSASGLIQCVGGVWSLMQGVRTTQVVASPDQSCGIASNMVTATCPAGYKITGGGYVLSSWAPLVNQSSNAPDLTIPQGNGWAVRAGGTNGNSCFVAYAVCGQ